MASFLSYRLDARPTDAEDLKESLYISEAKNVILIVLFVLLLDIQAMHFDRDDINLPGFHKFFKESAEEEMEHAKKVFKKSKVKRTQNQSRPACMRFSAPVLCVCLHGV